MVGHGGSIASSYLADPTSPIPSHCASIVATSTVRVNVCMDLPFDKQTTSRFITGFTSYDLHTLVSHYYDTAGIRKKYHYIQTTKISSINFNCFVIVGILMWYHNKQHFELPDIVITRDYCRSVALQDHMSYLL